MSDDSIFSSRSGSTREPVDVTPDPDEERDEPRGFGGFGGFRGDDSDPEPEGGPRRPMSTRRRIVFASVLAVGLAGMTAVGIFGARVIQQKDATLTTPNEVAGLVLDDSERARATADDLRAAFAAGIALDESLGAVYTDPAAAERSVLFFGGTTLLWSPERDLDTLFGLIGDESGDVTGLHEVPAGDLGGVMKCGTTSTDDGGSMAVCGWADHGSTAMALFPGRTAEESGTILGEMRAVIQTRD